MDAVVPQDYYEPRFVGAPCWGAGPGAAGCAQCESCVGFTGLVPGTCIDIGLKPCNNAAAGIQSCIPVTDCCPGCPDGSTCSNGTCVGPPPPPPPPTSNGASGVALLGIAAVVGLGAFMLVRSR